MLGLLLKVLLLYISYTCTRQHRESISLKGGRAGREEISAVLPRHEITFLHPVGPQRQSLMQFRLLGVVSPFCTPRDVPLLCKKKRGCKVCEIFTPCSAHALSLPCTRCYLPSHRLLSNRLPCPRPFVSSACLLGQSLLPVPICPGEVLVVQW